MKKVTLRLLFYRKISVKFLKETGVTFECLTSFVNEAISSSKFQDSRKLSNIMPVHKKKDRTDKSNYRPINILSLLSKIFEKIMFDQSYIYMNNILNKLLCVFHKPYSTQNTIFQLLQAWQKELDNSGFIRALLMDLSKAYDCLPHDLLIVNFSK